MTPELFYKTVSDDGKYWEELTEQQQEKITMYDLILKNGFLQNTYLKIFQFFFIESIIFENDMFIILKDKIPDGSKLKMEDVHGVITGDTFLEVIDLIQQICCIHEKEENAENIQFKNNTAKKYYEKMLKAKKNKAKKHDINMTLPNIISSVSCKHPSINPINVWDLTIFQLIDSFNRLQTNELYDIDCTRVSVWGDEKKTFDISLWYKNSYEI